MLLTFGTLGERRNTGQRQKVSISERKLRGCWLTVRRYRIGWIDCLKQVRVPFSQKTTSVEDDWSKLTGSILEVY